MGHTNLTEYKVSFNHCGVLEPAIFYSVFLFLCLLWALSLLMQLSLLVVSLMEQ